MASVRRPVVVRGIAPATAVLLGAGALVAVATAPGYPQVAVGVVTGQAWVASSPRGELALIDGSTDDVVTRVKVATPGAALRLAQSGTDVVVADRSTGTVSRVSGATHAVAPASVRRPIPGATDGLSLVGGGATDAVYAIDSAQGLAAPLPSVADAAASEPVSLAATLDPASTVVDRAGRFWAVEPATGDVVRVDPGGAKHQWRGLASPGSRLVPAGDRVALVDLSRRTAARLDEDAAAERSACVDPRGGNAAAVAVGAAPDGSAVFLADSSRGVLLTSSFRSGDCSRAVSLRTGEHRLGPPVVVGARVFVPDYTSGAVHVVDSARNVLLASPAVLPGGATAFELFPRDGVVFYNDPGSERAGVIKMDGTFRAVAKYTAAGAALVPRAGNPTKSQVKARKGDSTLPGGTGGGTGGAVPGAGGPARDGKVLLPPAAGTAAGPLRIAATPGPYLAGRWVALTAVPADGTSQVAGVSWTFGDGGRGQGVGVTHTWQRAGTYRITASGTVGGRPATAAADLAVLAADDGPRLPADPTDPTAPPTGPAPTGTPTPSTSPPSRVPARPVITGLTDSGDGQSVSLQVTFGSDTPSGTAAPDVATIQWGGGTLQRQAAPGSNTYAVTSLAPGTLTFTVTACSADRVCGPASAPRTVTIAARTAPGVPSLRLASGNRTANMVGLTAYLPSAGSGTVTSVTFTLSGGASASRTEAVSAVPIETTTLFTGIAAGVDISAVARVCNSDGQCASSAPLTVRAYDDPVAPAITLRQTGDQVVAQWGAADTSKLAPDPSAIVKINDLTSSSGGTTCTAVPTAAGSCTLAWVSGHRYQAEYRLDTYPMSDTSSSGVVEVP